MELIYNETIKSYDLKTIQTFIHGKLAYYNE